ncbi:hypothetical protein [Streptomyces neyagawaensis]|uniref:hypothetical protein n=1 Tax=Streptomyces neyagawaensis TaxID=42238 RepID=UPI0006E2A190|nr:hypothetical protein [Streptomyces neyagawaensis]MCL6733290.1 hypothetical protein [Streptomyces neyagawaensis]MDE1685092.1 hypothetical protein [Streptomyces neyagawaensis]
MAKVRFIGPEPVTVPELGPERVVQPDEIVTVPDDRYDGYVCQPAAWEEIEPPADEDKDEALPLGGLGAGEAVVKKATVKKTTAAAKAEPQKED